MADKKIKKIRKFRRPMGVNIGMIVFLIIFLYLLITVIIAATKPQVSITQVESGEIVDSISFTGIALREEQIVTTPEAGYMNYYISNGERTAKDKYVCVIDTQGTYSAESEDTSIEFTPSDYSEISDIISLYSSNYSGSRFSDIYSFKYNLQNSVTEIISRQRINNASGDSAALHQIAAPASGIVSYSYDNMESLTADDITDDLFNYSNYENHQLTSSERLEANAPAFRLTTNNVWSIVIKLSPEQAASLNETLNENNTNVQIRFVKDDITTWATGRIFGSGDSMYAELEMTRYMIRYIYDRYIDIELTTNEAEGLKIPSSSVVEKDFYKIPVSYLVTEEDTNEQGFYRTSADGTTTEFVKPTIYKQDDEFCYVDMNEFNLGDYIGEADSGVEQYRIGATESLTGVYNVNQGYAVFRLIDVIYQNDDYYIVRTGTSYGITLYDHIVLNASAVNEDDIIF